MLVNGSQSPCEEAPIVPREPDHPRAPVDELSTGIRQRRLVRESNDIFEYRFPLHGTETTLFYERREEVHGVRIPRVD